MEHPIGLSPDEDDFGVLERPDAGNLLIKQDRLSLRLPAQSIHASRRYASLEFELLEEPELEASVRIAQMKTGSGACNLPVVDRIIGKLGAKRGIEAVRVEFRILGVRGAKGTHGGERAEPGLRQQRRKGVVDRRKALANQFKSFQKTSKQQGNRT